MAQASAFAPGTLAAHAVCVAAGTRDGLRAAQFYIRDLATADRSNASDQVQAPWLSRTVARAARLVDQFMNWGARLAIRLILPSWRQLPSPFTPGMLHEVAAGIRENSLVHNPLFNAYFFRAALHIARRYSAPPHLILEHRVDAARRQLAHELADGLPEVDMLARILIALVEQAPIARIGTVAERDRFFALVEPNIAVSAIACVALMFAEAGKPAAGIEEDEFFSVTGALIGPRLHTFADLIGRRDAAGLARELADIKSMY
jgi:hypothetical protein